MSEDNSSRDENETCSTYLINDFSILAICSEKKSFDNSLTHKKTTTKNLFFKVILKIITNYVRKKMLSKSEAA